VIRKIATLLFLTLSITSTLQGKDTSIATVDMNRIFNEYIEFQDAKRELDRFVLEWERQKDSLKQYIDSLKNLLEIEKPGLTEKGREKRELEIQKAQEAYSNFIKNIWGDNGLFYKKSSELLEPYYKKIQETIKNVAVANGFDLVLNNDAKVILYVSNSQDITDKVLQELNKTYAQQTISGGKRYRIAVFPLMETEPGAQKLQLGNRLQKSLYQGITGNVLLEVIPTDNVNKEISRSNLTNNKLFPETCKQIALSLNADYFVCGTVETSGENVNFVYQLYRTATGEKLQEITGSATDPRESLDVESLQKARLLSQQFKP
jgi:Skp family chaperone for outer membrane proteins/TolB-like protein